MCTHTQMYSEKERQTDRYADKQTQREERQRDTESGRHRETGKTDTEKDRGETQRLRMKKKQISYHFWKFYQGNI